MGILIGMDEAGYGPNLGPLVVAATAWEVAEEGVRRCEPSIGSRESGVGKKTSAVGGVATLASAAMRNADANDLYPLLRGTICRKPSERCIAIADSKVLYKPGVGLRQLERGVHSVMLAMRRSIGCWSEMVDCCGADPAGHHRRLCWHDGFNCTVPVDAAADELSRLGERLAKACEAQGVRPLAIRARLVFPAEFNELTDHFSSKGTALSHVTIGLLREVMDDLNELEDAPVRSVFALCDKHGARNFYTAMLQHHFSEHWISPVFETHAESRYEWGADDARTCVSFRMKGESFLPTALASMTAKYLRELAMRAFNEFWCARIPGLRPTAGYCGDAPRFKREIAGLQRELGIDDHVLWRNR